MAIPGYRPLQPCLEVEVGCPTEFRTRPRCGEILMANLVRGFVTNLRPDIGAQQRRDSLDQLKHRDLNLVRKIVRSPDKFRTLRQLLRQMYVRTRAIFYVEIVANVFSVGSDERSFAAQQRTNRAWNEPIPVEVPTPVEVAAAGHRHGELVRVGIRLCDEIGARLTDVIRMSPCERRIFSVW